MEMAGAKVLITGASSGIGRSCAVEFARFGARVALVSRGREGLAEIAQQLRSAPRLDRRLAPDGDFLVLPSDLSQSQDRDHLVRRVLSEWGGVDVLVNCAGWAGFGPLVGQHETAIVRMITLNVEAPVALIQAFLPGMIASGQGAIVNVASILAHQPFPRMAVYSATKAALLRLSQGLRMELSGTGVRVICACPASTRTPFFDHAECLGVYSRRPKKAQLSPETVAAAVVRACRRGRNADLSIGFQTSCMDWIRRFSPGLADRLALYVADRALPRA